MTLIDRMIKFFCYDENNTQNQNSIDLDKELNKQYEEDTKLAKELKSILRSMLFSKERLIKTAKKNNLKHQKWHLCKRCHGVTIPLEEFHCYECYKIVLARWIS